MRPSLSRQGVQIRTVFVVFPLKMQSDGFSVPDVVRRWVTHLSTALAERNFVETSALYESSLPRISERFFKASSWPNPDLIAPLAGNHPQALQLYKQIYFRHMLSIGELSSNITELLYAHSNTVDLLLWLTTPSIEASESESGADIPNQWLWDIVEDYTNQLFCIWAHPEANANVPTVQKALTFLTERVLSSGLLGERATLPSIGKSTEKAVLQEMADIDYEKDENTGSSSEILQILNQEHLVGAFALIQIGQIYINLGDFSSCLAQLTVLPLRKSSILGRIFSCYTCVHYMLGFCYLMQRRYTDALKTFCAILSHAGKAFKSARALIISSNKSCFDMTASFIEKSIVLATVSYALSGQRIEESVLSVLRDGFEDQLQAMVGGEEGVFAEMFFLGAPLFVDIGSQNIKRRNIVCDSFLKQIKMRFNALSSVDILRLYKSISMEKLGSMVGSKDSVRQQLLSAKHLTNGLRWKGGSLESGTVESSLGLDFYIDAKEIIHASDIKNGKKFGEFFLRQAQKLEELSSSIQRINRV